MRVDIELIIEIQNELDEINKLNIEEIKWYKEGKMIEVDKKAVEDWKYTGLSNKDFVNIFFMS